MSQKTTNLEATNLVLDGVVEAVDSAVLLQNGVAADLAPFTVLGKIAADGKWKAFDETATDGAAVNVGIYVGAAVAATDIAAGDISGLDIIVGGAGLRVNDELLVIEGGKTLDTVIGGTTVNATTLREVLHKQGIYPTATKTTTK